VAQNITNENLFTSIVDPSYQPALVIADVEHNTCANFV